MLRTLIFLFASLSSFQSAWAEHGDVDVAMDLACKTHLQHLKARVSYSQIPPNVRLSETESSLPFIATQGAYFSENTSIQYSHNLLQVASEGMREGERILVLGVGSGYEMVALSRKFLNRLSALHGTDRFRLPLRLTQANLDAYQIQSPKIKIWESNAFEKVTESYDRILFAAPRAVYSASFKKMGWTEARVENHMSRLQEHEELFDVEGRLLTKITTDVKRHLTPGGTLFLLANLEHGVEPQNGILMTCHGQWHWSSENPRDDFYSILKMKRLER